MYAVLAHQQPGSLRCAVACQCAAETVLEAPNRPTPEPARPPTACIGLQFAVNSPQHSPTPAHFAAAFNTLHIFNPVHVKSGTGKKREAEVES